MTNMMIGADTGNEVTKKQDLVHPMNVQQSGAQGIAERILVFFESVDGRHVDTKHRETAMDQRNVQRHQVLADANR